MKVKIIKIRLLLKLAGMLLVILLFVLTTPTFAFATQTLYAVDSSTDSFYIVDNPNAGGSVTIIGPLDQDSDPSENRFVTPQGMSIRPSDHTIFVTNNRSYSGYPPVAVDLLTVNPNTGEATIVHTNPQEGPNSLAFAPDGTLYGAGGPSSSSWNRFYRVDTITGYPTYIGDLGVRIAGMDFSPDGILYAAGTDIFVYPHVTNLYTINPLNAQKSLVGTLNMPEENLGCITFDPSGTLIGSGFTAPPSSGETPTQSLFDIDITNAEVSNVRDIEEAPQGMDFLVTEPTVQPPIIDSFSVITECGNTGTSLLEVRFECSAHDPDGTIGLYQIDFGDNTSQLINRTGIFTHTYSQKNEYNVTCLVVDNTGNIASSEPTKYGGNNNHIGPILIPIDSDEDALYDCWEIHGFDSDVNDGVIDVPLNLMGADPRHKDVFLEIDYMVDNGTCIPLVGCLGAHSHKPKQEALNYIIDSFSRAPVWNPDLSIGINLHIDIGPDSEMNPITGETWGTHSRSNEIFEAKYVDTTTDGIFLPDQEILNQLNSSYNSARQRTFHYCLFGHNLAKDINVSGISVNIPSSVFYVTLGGWPDNGGISRQAGTTMHELGHNLGLTHGGPNKFSSVDATYDQSYKPNYLVSVRGNKYLL